MLGNSTKKEDFIKGENADDDDESETKRKEKLFF